MYIESKHTAPFIILDLYHAEIHRTPLNEVYDGETLYGYPIIRGNLIEGQFVLPENYRDIDKNRLSCKNTD